MSLLLCSPLAICMVHRLNLIISQCAESRFCRGFPHLLIFCVLNPRFHCQLEFDARGACYAFPSLAHLLSFTSLLQTLRQSSNMPNITREDSDTDFFSYNGAWTELRDPRYHDGRARK